MTQSNSIPREGSSAINLELAKDGSTRLPAEDHRGSYDRGLPIGSSFGAMGPDPWGGQPTGPPPEWPAHPPPRAFPSISAPKFLTTDHNRFYRRPAHERKPSSLTIFFSFHCLSLNLSLTRAIRPRNSFPDMI